MRHFPDLGLLDRFYVRKVHKVKGEIDIERASTPEIITDKTSEQFWFCFLPSDVYDRPNSIPKEGNIVKYRIPPIHLAISTNPSKTRFLLHRISDDVNLRIATDNLAQEQINFQAYSLGNTIPYCLMGNGHKAEQFISVFPGASLP
jgi:hypothetical protein